MDEGNLIHIDKAADRHGVPRPILRSLGTAESQGDPWAVSHAGAVGMFQVMPQTAVELGYNPSDMFDPEKASEAAARYMRKLYDRFGDWNLAVAAYNSGPARVAHRLERGIQFPRETVNHVAKVNALQGASALAGRIR